MQVWNVLHTACWKCTPPQSPKICHLGTITQLWRAISLQVATKACIHNWKKIVKQQCLPHISSQCGELRPTNGWDRSGSLLVWGTPANFNGFRVLALLLQRRCSMEANQTLQDVWPSRGLLHYIFIFGGSCSVMEFCQVQSSLSSKSCALLHWQHYCTAL